MAFVFDQDRGFRARCNLGMVELERLEDGSDVWLVRNLIEEHARLTGSGLARRILDNWESTKNRFVKVMPVEYRHVLERRKTQVTRPPEKVASTPIRKVIGG